MLVRKTVTVLFCDVDESVELGERHDPESLRRAMFRYFDEASAVLERHGGTVEKFIGDAIMAVFGIPVVHEDDAVRAVRAAAELQERIGALNAELERDFGIRVALQIGVDTGEVVVGDPRDGRTLATGDAINVAARLQQAAGPGEILIGTSTYALVRDAVTAGPLESFPVKGKSADVPRRRIERVDIRAAGLARRLDRPMVGRAEELDRLRAAFQWAVEERSCRIFTVLGAAGIGKSRLAQELLRSLSVQARSFVGRCLPYGDGITFWPLLQMLRKALEVADSIGALAGDDDAELIRERLDALLSPTAPGGGEETFWAVRKLLEALACERPLVLVFEDIHWGEPTFLDLIEYLAGWSRDAPILLLCIARPELLEQRPGWVTPHRNADSLALDPLTEAESERLLNSLSGDEALDRDVRVRISEAAEGNPLFVEQMVAMLSEEDSAELAIPPSIHALLAERLDRLTDEERAVIERAAVVGREFWRGAVLDLSPPGLRGGVGTHLMSLVRRELIRPDTSAFVGEDAFRFRHALICDAAYAGIAKELRAELHERFAGWVETNAGERSAELDEIVGYHLEQAYRYREQLGPVDDAARGLASRAGELLGAAGQRAFARDDMPGALKLLDRAVALVSDDYPARLELIRELSTALWVIGELARAESLLNGLIEAAAAVGDRRQEWYALLERSARRSFAGVEADAEEFLHVAERAIDVFEELGDDLGLARAWRRVSQAHRVLCRYGASQDACERALAHARRAGNVQEESRIVDGLCTSLLFGPAPAPEAIERCEEMAAQARGSLLMEANVISSLAGLLALRGRFDEARELCARAEHGYEELGLRLPIAGLSQIRGPLELAAGDAAAAERELRRGYEIVASVGARAFQGALLAEALNAQGRSDEAEQLAVIAEESAAPDAISEQVLWRTVRARLEARSGNVERAVALGREAAALAAETDALTLHGDALLALADVLLAAERADDAVAAARTALSLYERKGNLVGAGRAAALVTEPVR